MPRKTGGDRAGVVLTAARFNEAAARCRGKPSGHDPGDGRDLFLASMRPRPDAAENRRAGRADGPAAGASMRPRPDAAENLMSLLLA